MKHVYFSFTTTKLLYWRHNDLFDVAANAFRPLYWADSNKEYTADDIEVKHSARLGVKMYNAMEKALRLNSFYASIWVTDTEYKTMVQAGDKSPIRITDRLIEDDPYSAVGFLKFPASIL